jgi:acetyl esterase/lipase
VIDSRRTLVASVAIVVAVLLLRGGAPTSYAGGTRYLDEVFPNVTVTSNIAYGQAIDEHGQLETLRLDLYQPTGDTLPYRPVLVFVHGGSFTGGDKANADPVTYARAFAKRGYVTASINYRLREEGFPPEQQIFAIEDAQHDAQAAVRWFRANAAIHGIDVNRISISGYSAGAATALFVAYNQDNVGDSGNPGYPSNVSATIDVSGGVYTPLMEPGEPPVMIVHGTADTTSPYSRAEEIVDQAEAVGIPYELHPLIGEGHTIFGSHMTEIVGWSSTFLYQYVTGGVGGGADLPLAVDRPAGGSSVLVLVLATIAAALGWSMLRMRSTVSARARGNRR